MTSKSSSPPAANRYSERDSALQEEYSSSLQTTTRFAGSSSPPAKLPSNCSRPFPELFPTCSGVKRYSTSCPPHTAKRRKYYLPTRIYRNRGEEEEEITPSGGQFRPIIYYSNEDSGDEDSLGTRSSSYVSVDSAYSSQSDAIKKSSPLVSKQSQPIDGANGSSPLVSIQSKSIADTSARPIQPRPPCKPISAKLQYRSLWKTFLDVGNEMIVTKPGR